MKLLINSEASLVINYYSFGYFNSPLRIQLKLMYFYTGEEMNLAVLEESHPLLSSTHCSEKLPCPRRC